MSTMLEQALIDAAALKEAALKNAEDAILERYSSEVRNQMDSLLEQELDDMGLDAGAEEDLAAVDQADFGATEGEAACPCPDDEEVKTYSFTMDDFRQLEDELGLEDADMERREDLVTEPGLGTDEDEELPLELQEELELDEELLYEYPEEDEKELTEQEEVDEDVLPEGIDIDKLVEEVIVDLAGDELTGWAGRAGSDIDYAKEIRLARLASTEAKERHEKLQAHVDRLQESNKAVVDQNKILKQTLETLKGKLEEVNLSNAKLLYMNRTLSSTSLNERQTTKIVESIQKADSVEEAKVIFETLQSAVGTSERREPKSLSEAIRRPSLSVPTRRSQKSSKDTIVKERFQRLAGISKTDK